MRNLFIKNFTLINPKGFTLIELLIVIAILGIIIAAVVAGIDPVDKINAANDAKVQADLGAIGTAFEVNITSTTTGYYATSIAALTTSGDLKASLTPPNTNYSYNVVCTATNCTSQEVWTQLNSKKYKNTTTTYWKWCSVSGKASAASSTACP